MTVTPGNKPRRSYRTIAGNILFYGLLVFLIFNADAKSWVLRQLASTGLFRAEIKKEAIVPVSSPLALSYKTTGGNIQSLDALQGKVVFINFWASWCPPCLAEMPSLHELYNRYKNDDRIIFLFINEDEDLRKAKRYLEKKGYNMPLLTRSGTVSEELFSGSLPTTIILNKKGEIVLKKEGLADYHNKSFIRQLEALL